MRDNTLLLQPVSFFAKYNPAATKLQFAISLFIIIVCACMCVCEKERVYVYMSVCIHIWVGRRLKFMNHWLIHDACMIMVAVLSCGCLHAALVAFDHMIVLCVQTQTCCHSVTVK